MTKKNKVSNISYGINDLKKFCQDCHINQAYHQFNNAGITLLDLITFEPSQISDICQEFGISFADKQRLNNFLEQCHRNRGNRQDSRFFLFFIFLLIVSV